MLELVVLTPAFGMRNVSPFCLKAEMLLTALEIPFKLVEEADPRKTPKGKLPYLIANGEKIGDSEIITEYIDNMTDGKVYAGLTPQQRAQGVALARLAEDHLYWLIISSRWLDDAWWPNIPDAFFGIAPKFIRGIVANGARKQVIKGAQAQGLGKHSLAEQQDFARRDLTALQDSVPSTGFLFSSSPDIFDFTIASMMSGIYDNQPETWLTKVAQEFPALQEYTERVQSAVGVYGRHLGD